MKTNRFLDLLNGASKLVEQLRTMPDGALEAQWSAIKGQLLVLIDDMDREQILSKKYDVGP